MHILIEALYAKNNVVKQITEGISSVLKKKHVKLHIYTDIKKIPENTDICAVIAQSLSFVIKAVEALSILSIHPLVFGFGQLDTPYTYSTITPDHTKSVYRLTEYILRDSPGKTALLGYNPDSLPDRLKHNGMRHAVLEAGGEYVIFENSGDPIVCIEKFIREGDDIKNIVCCNDSIAVLLHSRYRNYIKGRKMCSCSGLKLSEYFEDPYPACRCNYVSAGEQIARLYLFLLKEKPINSTSMTLDMNFSIGREPLIIPEREGVVHLENREEVDFFGDSNIKTIENLEIMLNELDSLDFDILKDLTNGLTYEDIADKYYISVNTAKYRVHSMVAAAGVSSRRDLLSLLSDYMIKFNQDD